MFGLLNLVFGFLGGPFARSAIEAYKARLAAGETHDRIAADLAAKQAEVATQREALAKDVVVAEQGNWATRLMRPAFAYPVAFYYAKIFVWDKALGMGRTDALSPELTQIAMVIIGALFGQLAIENAARIVRRR